MKAKGEISYSFFFEKVMTKEEEMTEWRS